ncbi:hypothetical protein E5288_WYG012195 [Bos mutus]|uniref:Uncharacterized protein n=1 Tax=Bos mutus TaxID=72004 RepID=A0A6B0RFB5_9CETA|nr:hypothetical protein [Bos mutus]
MPARRVEGGEPIQAAVRSVSVDAEDTGPVVGTVWAALYPALYCLDLVSLSPPPVQVSRTPAYLLHKPTQVRPADYPPRTGCQLAFDLVLTGPLHIREDLRIGCDPPEHLLGLRSYLADPQPLREQRGGPHGASSIYMLMAVVCAFNGKRLQPMHGK